MSDCWAYEWQMKAAKQNLQAAMEREDWFRASQHERDWKKYRRLYQSSDEYRERMNHVQTQ